jgi:hypothetical protein
MDVINAVQFIIFPQNPHIPGVSGGHICACTFVFKQTPESSRRKNSLHKDGDIIPTVIPVIAAVQGGVHTHNL